MTVRLLLAFLTPVLALLASSGPGPTEPRPIKPDRSLEILATPIDDGLRDGPVGALTLRAALALSSPDEDFGGWSALHVEPNGDFLALSDRAFLLRGRFNQTADGIPTGVSDGVIGVLRDQGGEDAPRLRGDAEGMARLPDGRFVLSFENPPRIGFYDFGSDGTRARLNLGPPLADALRLGRHAQLESVTVLPGGDILVGSERGFNESGNAVLWRTASNADSRSPPVRPLTTIKTPANLSLTELAAAPDGSVFALFRFYIPFLGARAQIWRYTILEENGRTHAQGQALATLKPPFPVDNYEGMALIVPPDGGLRLYVISDDNFRSRQRTLLLVFDLNEKAPESGASSKSG